MVGQGLEMTQKNEGGLNTLIDIKTNRYICQCGLLVQKIHNKPCSEIGFSILP